MHIYFRSKISNHMTGCRLETLKKQGQDKEVVSKRLAELKAEYFDGVDVETAEKKKYEES